MEYNNYYPVQSGHPPPQNQQHAGGPQMHHPHQPPPPQQSGQMIQSPLVQQQNTRPTMPPGPPNHHQQMQQMQSQQHIAHHPQQQHPNYQQIQPSHPHGPVAHSSSPHAQQQHHNNNHQPNMPGQMPAQPPVPQHVHSQSPHHHHGGQPIHVQQHQQQQHQPLNQMVRPPPVVNQHPHPGSQQSPGHHHLPHQPQQNFYAGGGGPMPQTNLHHYPPNQHHHPVHQPPQHHAPPVMHHAPSMQPHLHPHLQPQSIGRNSPYYPNILQTEFRIIELNRRLQCRPAFRHPFNPLPGPYDESIWWERFAADFFEDDAILTLRLHDDKPVEYTIGRTLIPRFFRSYFDGGVTDLSISLRNPKETCINPHMITLDCDQAFIVTNNIFRHPSLVSNQGVVVHTEGHLTLDFVSNSFDNLLIKSWRFYTRGNREFIDRAILNTMGLPNNYLVEPITRLGFTKSTITYLKMCMVMEPMQELMFQHKRTKKDPRTCLRDLLYDRYKFRSSEDSRTTTNKRKRKKAPAAQAMPGNTATTNKRTKAGINNAMANNGGMNTMIMSPSGGGPQSFSLATQDVMVVGEPSMMGGDFGDDNERMITRLVNTQYDPTASTLSNGEESDSLNAVANTEVMNSRDETDSIGLENHTMSPSIMQQVPQAQHQSDSQQQHHLHNQVPQHPSPQQQSANLMGSQQERSEESTGPMVGHHDQHQSEDEQQQKQSQQQQQSEPQLMATNMGEDVIQNDLGLNNLSQQENLIEKSHDRGQHEQETDQQSGVKQGPLEQNGQDTLQTGELGHPVDGSEQNLDGDQALNDDKGAQVNLSESSDMVSISDSKANTNMKHNICSAEQSENHSDSVQTINEESNSNSQLPCSTANATTAMEQQQPVDNGVA